MKLLNLNFMVVVSFLGVTAWAESPVVAGAIPQSSIPQYDQVYQRLARARVSSRFIERLKQHANLEFKEYALKANTLGFLRKLDHSHLVSEDGEQQCVQLLNQYAEAVQYCSARYRVPSQVMAALLWIETKHGRDLGKHHLASVFMSIASADTAASRGFLEGELLTHFNGKKDKEYRLARQQLQRQIKKKSAWALAELKALAKIWDAPKKFGVDPLEWRGSISGAFGVAQFLPSSYLRWSADGNQDGKVDLFAVEDALCSVGRYLHLSGWKSASPRTKKLAIYRYNNSGDYVDSVLKLADRVDLAKKSAGRRTASVLAAVAAPQAVADVKAPDANVPAAQAPEAKTP